MLYPVQSLQGATRTLDTEVNEQTILLPTSPTIGIQAYSLVGDVLRLVPHENCTGDAKPEHVAWGVQCSRTAARSHRAS